MKQQHQMKIKSMQKFVPFLSKLLERLKTESGNETKIGQMQLFLDLLICPNASVTSEEIDKCEHELSSLYESYESDSALASARTEHQAPCEAVQVEELSQESPDNKPAKDDYQPSQEAPANPEETSEDQTNATILAKSSEYSKVDTCVNEQPSEMVNDRAITKSPVKESSKHPIKSLSAYQQNSTECGKISENSSKELKECMKINDEENIDLVISEKATYFSLSKDDENKKEEEKNAKEPNSSDSDLSDGDGNENNFNTAASEDSVGKKINAVPGGENADVKPKSSDSDLNDRDKNENHLNTAASEDSEVEKKETLPAKASAEVEAKSSDSVQSNRDKNENNLNTAASEGSEDEKREFLASAEIKTRSSDSDQRYIGKNENNLNTAGSGHSDSKKIKAVPAGDSDSGESEAVVSEDSDDGEVEENVEIVKYPEVESDEMILPDSAEEETNTLNSNADNLSPETEEKSECQEEYNEDEDPTSEPELIAFASGSDSKDDDKNDNNDPLNVEESIGKNNKIATNPNPAAEDDDDDDDVQLIETRNSPICVDSDDDSDQLAITNTSGSTTQNPSKMVENDVPKKAIKSKSTPMPQKRSTRSLPAVSSVIDTIDLLDSSDEEQPQYTKPALISPVKRCLLPKPIRQSKRKRSPSTPTPSLKPQIRGAPKPPTQLHISTPQSNFLNAVNLQPANTANPPAFSAQLLNKNVIIPNAFYGNPPDVRSKTKSKKTIQSSSKSQDTTSTEITAQQEKIYRRWLDNFLINFASPLQIVSHTTFVLLQRVLKYKFFQRVKEARTNLNVMAQRQLTNETPASLDIQLMLDLRKVLFNEEAQLSETGIRFCELASTQAFGKSVPLTTDIKSGRVTSRTRVDDEATQSATPNKNFNGLTKSTLNQTNGYTKKNKKDDTDEYTPNKPVVIAGDGGSSVHGERKRSLRTNRSKRYDNNFSYNEDQHDDDEEDEEEDSYAAIARKIEQKRQEAKQKREREAKSFESAFIEAFSKQIDVSATKRQKLGTMNGSKNNYKETFSISPAILEVEMRCGEGSLDANVNVDDHQYEDADSLDDGPREHRIYKVAPTAPYKRPKRQSLRALKPELSLVSEVITCSDGSDENEDCESSRVDLVPVPKNTNRTMFISKNNDTVNYFCIICRQQVQRIVHHYVNQHRGYEVYTSRLSGIQLTQLRRSKGNMAQMTHYKKGQNQYEATCAFCQKRSRFMLSYWYQHFTMHTGEYSYRCGGCGTRKPTRSLLLAHLKTRCRKDASMCQDFSFEANTNQIEARVCTLCNYIQLHRSNVVQHLRTQHGLREILPKHIQSVVLLKIPATPSTSQKPVIQQLDLKELDSASSCSTATANSNSNLRKFFDSFEDSSAAQFTYDDDDPSDDLSFMICGMLDVQMNTD